MDRGVGWMISSNQKGCRVQDGPFNQEAWHWSNGKTWNHDPNISVTAYHQDDASNEQLSSSLDQRAPLDGGKEKRRQEAIAAMTAAVYQERIAVMGAQLQRMRGQLVAATSALEETIDEARRLRSENEVSLGE